MSGVKNPPPGSLALPDRKKKLIVWPLGSGSPALSKIAAFRTTVSPCGVVPFSGVTSSPGSPSAAITGAANAADPNALRTTIAANLVATALRVRIEDPFTSTSADTADRAPGTTVSPEPPVPDTCRTRRTLYAREQRNKYQLVPRGWPRPVGRCPHAPVRRRTSQTRRGEMVPVAVQSGSVEGCGVASRQRVGEIGRRG